MKFFKRFATGAMAVAMAAATALSFASCSAQNYTENNTEYVIGFSGPLTGGAAVYGKAVQNGAQLAVDEINAAGGLSGVKFKLIATDDTNEATKVATNYASMFEAGMQVSLGCVTTNPGLEFKNLSAQDNVFFLTPSASNDNIPTESNGYQMCFADGNQGRVAAEYVNANIDTLSQNKTIGIFYKSDDAYSKGIYEQFKATLSADIQTVEAVFSDANNTDFSSQIETLQNSSFIFMPIYCEPAALFMTQAKTKVAANAVYYGCDGLDGIDSIDGFDITTIPQEVSMLSHFNSKATEGAPKAFIDKYVAAYGSETLNQFGASAYDCVYAIFNAMKAAQEKDAAAVTVTMSASALCEVLKEQFNNGFSYSGVTGEDITWAANGYVNKTAIKYIIKTASAE